MNWTRQATTWLCLIAALTVAVRGTVGDVLVLALITGVLACQSVVRRHLAIPATAPAGSGSWTDTPVPAMEPSTPTKA